MQMDSKIIKPKGHTRVQWIVTVLINTAVFTYGLQSGWISPMTKILQSEKSPVGRALTDSELSLLAGVPALASVVGILITLYIVDNNGRKKAIFVVAVFQLMCWVIKICPTTFHSLVGARVCSGLGAGSCFHVVFIYIKEISQDNIRGTLVSMSTLIQNLGILTMYAIGGYLDYNVVLYLVVGIPILTMAVLYVAPESPSFLMKKGSPKEAAAAIAFLRGLNINDKMVQTEINSLQREDDYFKSIPKISFLSIFKDKAWRRGFNIMLAIMIVHSLNGAFSIVTYASTVLENSKIAINPELQTLAIPIFLIVASLITTMTIDNLGRKVLLGTTFFISTLTFGGLASMILLRDYGWNIPEWLPLIAILVIVGCYASGVSPVPYIIMTEMFNFQIRAKLLACLCILAWLLSFVQVVSFTAINNALGTHMSFYIFSAINLVGVVLVLVILPETGRKSIDQIETELRGKEKVLEEVLTSFKC